MSGSERPIIQSQLRTRHQPVYHDPRARPVYTISPANHLLQAQTSPSKWKS
jgi:hypothetical protein